MPTYLVLTRLTPETVKSPRDLQRLERAVSERIRKECLDLFEAPDEAAAARVVMIIRSFGHALTETWTALPWERFKQLIAA